MNMIRFFSSAARPTATSLLAQLRKNTGFTLSNCRKALELCNNDLAKAEEWLQAEAKRLGWEKAMKLQTRSASEGLIAISRSKNKICMVEVNCETDFVARNEKFVSLAEIVANACLTHNMPQSDTNIKKIVSQEELGDLRTLNEEKLSDYVAERIGEFGENIILRRGLVYEPDTGINVDVAVHPPVTDGRQVLTGKYGAFVAYEKEKDSSADKNIGNNLCKHIIGSSPQKIGEKKNATNEPASEDLSEDGCTNENEDGLLSQNYMLDPGLTVGEYVEEEGVKIIDFGRFECGEDIQSSENKKQEDQPEERARSI